MADLADNTSIIEIVTRGHKETYGEASKSIILKPEDNIEPFKVKALLHFLFLLKR